MGAPEAELTDFLYPRDFEGRTPIWHYLIGWLHPAGIMGMANPPLGFAYLINFTLTLGIVVAHGNVSAKLAWVAKVIISSIVAITR